jgi:hypothetical protein
MLPSPWTSPGLWGLSIFLIPWKGVQNKSELWLSGVDWRYQTLNREGE